MLTRHLLRVRSRSMGKKQANGGTVERHPDASKIRRLAKHYDSDADLARALGVEPQALNNWKRRGIAPAMRGRVYKLMQDHDCAPPLAWLTG